MTFRWLRQLQGVPEGVLEAEASKPSRPLDFEATTRDAPTSIMDWISTCGRLHFARLSHLSTSSSRLRSLRLLRGLP